MSDEYIAGLFDGEGCVSISQVKANRNKFHVRIAIGMTDKQVIYKLRDINFGNVHKDERIRNGKKCRTMYIWSVTGPKATEFLKKIRPYVIVKKIQVEAALVLREIQENFQPKTKILNVKGKFISGHGLTKEELEERLSLKKIVQEANYGKSGIYIN